MESNTLFSSVIAPLPFARRKLHSQKVKFGEIKSCRGSGKAYCSRSSESCEWNNMLVDESMIVLRKRIHEMKMIEKNYAPPSEWMEWEKQCYASYDQFICNFVGFLQSHLMNTRPTLALGIMFLITMSVPVSTVTIALQLMHAADGLLSAVHIG